MKKKTTEQFIEEARLIYGNMYDYSLVVYKGARVNVIIICPIHHEFTQTPDNHLQGRACKKCSDDKKTMTLEEFIRRSNLIHLDKFDYSHAIYMNARTKIKIICPFHGEFTQTPSEHLFGSGCRICSLVEQGLKRRKTNNQFLDDAKEVHGDLFIYDRTNYIYSCEEVEIGCRVEGHKYFWQNPNRHLSGHGCPKCNSSKGERKITKLLDEMNIVFEQEKRFDACRNINHLPLDFYLPEYNICIEFQGRQHYEPVEHFGGEEQFIKQQKHDQIKRDYCKDNDIELIEISYKDINNIEEIINNLITVFQTIVML